MTSIAALLPRPPAPPHDPKSFVLDARAGFRIAIAQGVEVAPLDGALVLAPLAGGVRGLAEAGGGFGGLALPPNVALGPDGMPLLLDGEKLVLRRFDPCACEFVRLPCIAGKGKEARRLGAPGGGITVACGNLYVCDPGNRRVQVFALRGLPLRAIWQQPAEAKLAQPWLPVVAASDGKDVYVADRDNGAILVFQASGRYLRALAGMGAVVALTVDCDGRLYVQRDADPDVRVVDPVSGAVLDVRRRADEVADRFAPLPFPVTPEGHLQLAALCVDPAAGAGEFDTHGAPVPPSASTPPSLEASGTVYTTALDSAIHRCTWDRLEIEGELRPGTTVRAFAFAAETALPDDLVTALPDDAWSACAAATAEASDAAAGARWDAMLRAQPGRFLRLKLVLEGDGHETPRIDRLRVIYPRVTLRRYLPGTFGADPVAAEFTDRFLAIFDCTFRGIERTVDWQAGLFDPLSAPTGKPGGGAPGDFLSWLATWLGVSLDRGWPEARRRRYLKKVGKLLPRRGTLDGLRDHLRLYLGLDEPRGCAPLPPCGPCTTTTTPPPRPPELVLEHYRLRRWMFLSRGRLGEASRLWGERIVNRSRLGSPDGGPGNAQVGVTRLDTAQDPFRDPFHVYAHKFSVFAPAAIARSPGARRGLDRLVRAERPAHAAYQIVWVEPRFRVGIQSMIGFDSVIGCYPGGGVTLGAAPLGRATVLGPGDDKGEPPAISSDARIGRTTRLR